MAGYKILGLFLVLTSLINLCTSQCNILAASCGNCIAKTGCAWCSDPKFDNKTQPNQRCNTWENMKKAAQCQQEFIEYPNTTHISTNKSEKDGGNGSWFSPKEIKLNLRVGQPYTFVMTYKDGGNRPLDLYYIMDLSATMEDDKIIVAAQSNALVEALEGVTPNVYLGFGSFIDKPLMPYATSIQLTGEYQPKNKTFGAPYLFKNHLQLTTNATKFQNTISEAEISVNSDAPEGGLEALMQAVTCTSQIGWRLDSRKLVILSTDGIFHIAGDGKLGGVVEPHDSQCHMPDSFTYTHGTILDYPSISQVNAKVQEQQMYVIFAVVKEHEELYRKLKEKIESSSVVILSANSSNVVQEITQEYKKISSTLKFDQFWEQTKQTNNVKITYSGKCPGSETDFVWTANNPGGCGKFPVDGKLEINVTIELQNCEVKEEFEVTICPSELCRTRPLRLKIKPICECIECKKNSKATKVNATECNFKGNLECGICSCNDKVMGRNCDCPKVSSEEEKNNQECKQPGDTRACSGRGECNCGSCTCAANSTGYSKYSGTFCEFDEDNCLSTSNGKICSGLGKCKDAKCQCKEGRIGSKCECSTRRCREPGINKTECNGRGSCSCKADYPCECQSGFTGRFCEHEQRKQRSRCNEKELLDCVKCEAELKEEDRSPAANLCNEECRKNSISFGIPGNYSNPSSCSFQDSQGCGRGFIYWNSFSRTGEEIWELQVKLEDTKSCPISSNRLILIVVLSVVAVGIFLLLLWKIVTYLHDRREYDQFKTASSGAAWGQGMNPLYKGAESNFQNPAYTNPNDPNTNTNESASTST